jgi:hypothetical protein
MMPRHESTRQVRGLAAFFLNLERVFARAFDLVKTLDERPAGL